MWKAHKSRVCATLRNFFCRQNKVSHKAGIQTWLHMKEHMHSIHKSDTSMWHFHATVSDASQKRAIFQVAWERHVTTWHVREKVIRLRLRYIKDDILAWYCQALHGCCMGVGWPCTLKHTFRGTRAAKKISVFPNELTNGISHPNSWYIYLSVYRLSPAEMLVEKNATPVPRFTSLFAHTENHVSVPNSYSTLIYQISVLSGHCPHMIDVSTAFRLIWGPLARRTNAVSVFHSAH